MKNADTSMPEILYTRQEELAVLILLQDGTIVDAEVIKSIVPDLICKESVFILTQVLEKKGFDLNKICQLIYGAGK